MTWRDQCDTQLIGRFPGEISKCDPRSNLYLPDAPSGHFLNIFCGVINIHIDYLRRSLPSRLSIAEIAASRDWLTADSEPEIIKRPFAPEEV